MRPWPLCIPAYGALCLAFEMEVWEVSEAQLMPPMAIMLAFIPCQGPIITIGLFTSMSLSVTILTRR